MDPSVPSTRYPGRWEFDDAVAAGNRRRLATEHGHRFGASGEPAAVGIDKCAHWSPTTCHANMSLGIEPASYSLISPKATGGSRDETDIADSGVGQ